MEPITWIVSALGDELKRVHSPNGRTGRVTIWGSVLQSQLEGSQSFRSLPEYSLFAGQQDQA